MNLKLDGIKFQKLFFKSLLVKASAAFQDDTIIYFKCLVFQYKMIWNTEYR